MADPHCEFEQENNVLSLKFTDHPKTTHRLEAAQVDEMIANLGSYRMKMEPKPTSDWKPGSKVDRAITDPRWYVEPEMMQGDILLHIRDLRFDWLHYILPRESARKLAEALISVADAPPPGPKHVRPN